MIKPLDKLITSKQEELLICALSREHIQNIVESVGSIGWNKPISLFEQYLAEAKAGKGLIWIAYVNDDFAGYVTLKWQSQYQSFKDQNIPEIMDLNVLPSFRRSGIASTLLDIAEQEAKTRNEIVGIGVGLYVGADGGYGAAQKLYVKRGYIPDGNGATYNYQSVVPGGSYPFDDDLVLWLTKKLK